MSNKLTLGVLGVAAALILAFAVVLIVVVAGGDGDKDGGEQAQSETPAASETEGSGDGDAGASSGELRIRGEDPLFLDPAIAQDAGSAFYIVEIFSGLVRLDKELTVQPDVAERWETSPDGKTYTFFLNRKATFHDGRPVTPEDVKYSLERALSPDTGSTTALNFLGDIVGAKDLARGRANELAGLKIVNDTTVALTIEAPNLSFLYKLTYPAAFLVDERQIKAKRDWTLDPNGTGPYKRKEWRLGVRFVLEAYEKHHLGPPKLKTVRIDLTGGSALVAYEDGEIDVTGIAVDDLAAIQDPSNKLNKEYASAPVQSIDYIGFNVTKAPFDDAKVRQAFALAVDRQKIGEVILKGADPVATGLLMEGVPGHTSEDKTYPYDPERARQLLSESKYGEDLPEITLTETGAGATVGPITEAIVQYWEDNLGVTVQIEQAESGQFFEDLDDRRYQMFHLGWIMDYPDPEDILDVLFHSESRQNNTAYADPAIDAQLEAARGEQDVERRLAIYREVEKKLIDDAVWVPMFFATAHGLIKPYVKGYEIPPAVVERFRDVEVER